MTTSKAYPRAHKLLDDILACDFEGVAVSHFDVLKFAINSYSALKYQGDWLNSGSLDKLDFRFQTFARIEIHTLTYYLSLVSTRDGLDSIIRECLDLGYSFEMAIDCATSIREVNLRISFLDRYFYTLEYFVQLMNKRFGFVTDGSVHKKQFYFTAMLKFFGMEENIYETENLLTALNTFFPSGNEDFLALANQKQCRNAINYGKFYEYAATMRNSLHNNGFSSKTLNNLDLGILSFKDIKQGASITCISTLHVAMLSLPLTRIVEEVAKKSMELLPGELIEDPYVKQLDNHIRKSRSLA